MPLQNGRANGALRKLGAVQEGVLRQSVRRGGEYVDQVLWSMLKEDWGDHWDVDRARAFISARHETVCRCRPRLCRLRDRRGRRGAGARACRTRDFSHSAGAVRGADRARVGHGGAQTDAAVHGQRLDDVGRRTRWTSRRCCCSGRTRRCSWRRPARSAACHLNKQRTAAAARHAVQHGGADRATVQGAGLALGLADASPARGHARDDRPSAARRRDGVLRWSARVSSRRPLALSSGTVASPRRGEPASSAARPSYFVGAGTAALVGAAWSDTTGYWIAPLGVRADLPDLPHLQGVPRPDRGRAAARAADLRSAPGDDRSAGARDRRQGSEHADAHPPRADLRRRHGQGGRPVAPTKSRASRRRRCSTTSASSPCPSTSCRSPAR